MVIPFVFLFLTFAQVTFGAFSSNWYTEEAFLDRENVLSSLIRVRGEYKLSTELAPYLTFGSDVQSKQQSILDVSGSSYAFGGPGFKVDYLGAQLFSELRGRSYYLQAPNQKNIDARILLVLGKYGDTDLGTNRKLLGFYEAYSETLFTSADENNLIEAAFIRSGVRNVLLKELMLDTYIEPFVTVDRIGHFYNNRADLKLSLRLLYNQPTFSFGLTGSYLVNQYFGYANFDRNPYQNEKSGFKVLFVAGGTF